MPDYCIKVTEWNFLESKTKIELQNFIFRFPAELIRVDTSARRFERTCGGRKSMLHVPLYIGEHNNLNDDVQTVKRRSRSRKPRNKRRNTIAGTDQKEIEEAVRGYVYSLLYFYFIC